MSTARRQSADAPPASDVAAALGEAGLVHLVASPDGDGLAATGLLAGALAERGVPFQARVADPTDGDERETDADATVAVGDPTPPADLGLPAEPSATETAVAVARELGGTVDHALALAGVLAAGREPAGAILERAREAGVERRPGIASPTADLADGLAHSTLVHAPFSGDPEAASAALADLDLPEQPASDDHRRVASLVAVEAVAGAPPGAAEAVERALGAYPIDGPVATAGGYADVLGALATDSPGTGLALALGGDVREAALEAWRDHARRAHAALREATTGRYDGLFVARDETGEAPPATTARLVQSYRSPEPVTLVVADGRAAACGRGDLDVGARLAAAAETLDGTGGGTARVGHARFDADADDLVTAFREAR